MQAFIHIKSARADGTYDSYLTKEVEVKEKLLPWQKANLSYTASGYGARVPTRYMIKYDNKWRRVYCTIYSNSGSCFIGKKFDPCLTISIES